jgi:D-tyrosyl-tRNA(Tyr) deacylase
MANKLVKLKIWDDDNGGRWKLSVLDLDYQVLMVSQFTLLANIKKGAKPDFHGACPPDLARGMYDSLLTRTRELYLKEKKLNASKATEVVQDGVFGAMMQVALVNDGPVTFELNSPQKTAVNATSQKGTPKGSKKGTPKGTPKDAPTPAEEIAAKVEEGLSLQS